MEDNEGAANKLGRDDELTATGHMLFSPSAVVFALSPEHRRQAAKCLRSNGEIRLSFKDVAITDLTGVRLLNGDGGVVVD